MRGKEEESARNMKSGRGQSNGQPKGVKEKEALSHLWADHLAGPSHFSDF